MVKKKNEKKETKIPMFIQPLGEPLKEKEIVFLREPSEAGELRHIYLQKRSSIEDFFYRMSLDCLTTDYLKRYAELSTESLNIAFAPAEGRIYQRIIHPIAMAKRAYCLGEYLAAVAMCGVATEMLTILLWEMNSGIILIQKKTITLLQEKIFFGRHFQELSQSRRLKIMRVLDQITRQQHDKFNYIRERRNYYIHKWVIIDPDTAQEDALKVYRKTILLFKEFSKIRMAGRPGKIKLATALLRYISKG